eukprot:jgi/Botrbrau1/20410/Bobra.0006s0067.1
MDALQSSTSHISDSAVKRLLVSEMPQTYLATGTETQISNVGRDAVEPKRQGLIVQRQCHHESVPRPEHKHPVSDKGHRVLHLHDKFKPINTFTAILQPHLKVPTFLEVLTGAVRTGQSYDTGKSLKKSPADMKDQSPLTSLTLEYVRPCSPTPNCIQSTDGHSISRGATSMSRNFDAARRQVQSQGHCTSNDIVPVDEAWRATFCTEVEPQAFKDIWGARLTFPAANGSAKARADTKTSCDSTTTDGHAAEYVAEDIPLLLLRMEHNPNLRSQSADKIYTRTTWLYKSGNAESCSARLRSRPRLTRPIPTSYPTRETTPDIVSSGQALYHMLKENPSESALYAFYYQQGTHFQIIAAEILKHQGWIYHTELKRWYKAVHGITKVTKDYQEGQFFYIDYKCNRNPQRRGKSRKASKNGVVNTTTSDQASDVWPWTIKTTGPNFAFNFKYWGP